MPRVPGNEYRSTLLKSVRRIGQYENSAAFQDVEGFVSEPGGSVQRRGAWGNFRDRNLWTAEGVKMGFTG